LFVPVLSLFRRQRRLKWKRGNSAMYKYTQLMYIYTKDKTSNKERQKTLFKEGVVTEHSTSRRRIVKHGTLSRIQFIANFWRFFFACGGFAVFD
jgi:hypothetical protein